MRTNRGADGPDWIPGGCGLASRALDGVHRLATAALHGATDGGSQDEGATDGGEPQSEDEGEEGLQQLGQRLDGVAFLIGGEVDEGGRGQPNGTTTSR